MEIRVLLIGEKEGRPGAHIHNDFWPQYSCPFEVRVCVQMKCSHRVSSHKQEEMYVHFSYMYSYLYTHTKHSLLVSGRNATIGKKCQVLGGGGVPPCSVCLCDNAYPHTCSLSSHTNTKTDILQQSTSSVLVPCCMIFTLYFYNNYY